VITGVQAAGKSTIARRLAQQFERGVHVEADILQRMIVSGGRWPGDPGPVEGEAARQLDLRLVNLCLLGRSFLAAGFTVVLDDIVLGERWGQLKRLLVGVPFSLIVLAPQVEVILARDRDRAKRTLGADWARYLDAELRRSMQGVGWWLDTSNLTVDESVAIIAAHLHQTPPQQHR
jgi:predicted kinase